MEAYPMKSYTRILAMLMAVLMVASMFVACGGSEDPATTEATTAATTAATTEATTAATTAATTTTEATTTEAPAVDLDGYVLSIVGGADLLPKQNADGSYTNAMQEEYADKLLDLEDEYGFILEAVSNPEGDFIEAMTAAALAGINYADVAYSQQYRIWPLAKNNAVIALDSDEMVAAGFDWSNDDNWFQPVTVWSEMWDHVWGVQVGGKYVAPQTGYFVTYNKEICAAAGYEDLYQLVREGAWTWDVYLDIAKKATQDTDGDGLIDQWGTGATAWGSEVVCNGVQFCGERDGKWQLTIDSEEGIRALQFLYDMNYGTGTCNLEASNNEKRQAFADGKVAFNWADMPKIMVGQICYNSNHDYGIVPMPMGPDADQYYSVVTGVPFIFIPSTNQNVDKTVAALNAWALIVNDIDAYAETIDDGRCRTEEDMEMMVDYIIPNFALNMGRITPDLWSMVDNHNGYEGLITEISYVGYTPQQAIERNAPKINAVLDLFFGQ